MKPFTLKCNKCGSEKVRLYPGYPGDSVTILCHNCDNSGSEYELMEDEEK